MTMDIVWTAPTELVSESATGRFMAEHAIDSYSEL